MQAGYFITAAVEPLGTSRRTGKRNLMDAGGVRPRWGRGLKASGISPDSSDHGAFAQHVTVLERRVQRALDSLTDELLGLVEPPSVTFHVVRRAGLRLGSVIMVQSAGSFGLLTAERARHAGVGSIVIVEPEETRRETGRRLGFTTSTHPETPSAPAF